MKNKFQVCMLKDQTDIKLLPHNFADFIKAARQWP